MSRELENLSRQIEKAGDAISYIKIEFNYVSDCLKAGEAKIAELEAKVKQLEDHCEHLNEIITGGDR